MEAVLIVIAAVILILLFRKQSKSSGALTMSRRAARAGDGTAWLVADGAEPAGFHCYWYAGRAEDHLVERAHLSTESAAVAWGRTRTPRVRIRASDRRSSWAGTAPRPAGIALTWIGPDPPEGTESC